MKLIIDIPDDDFNFIKDLKFVMGGRGNCKTIQYDVINAIKNGAPLPKGRGRLIDADDFFEVFSELDNEPYNNFPAVIEADKEADYYEKKT